MKNNAFFLFKLIILSLFLFSKNIIDCFSNFKIRTLDCKQDEYIFLFAHGLGATHEQVWRLLSRIRKEDNKHYIFNDFWIVQDPIATFDFVDAKGWNNYDNKHVCLGQEKDMASLHEAYTAINKTFPDAKIILVGISRGAATIINYVATHQSENIVGIILESPFDTFSSIIKHILGQYHVHWLPFSKKLGAKVLQKYFPSVNIEGICPLSVVEQIPKNIPVIFIHSKLDKVVPIKSSRKLFLKLKNVGHPDTYLLELQSGLHGKIIQGLDGEFYQKIVHAFLKRHNLPCDETIASQGERLLPLAQPSVQDVIQRLSKKRSLADDEELS